MKAEVWSKEYCPYCDKAKALLKQLNIPYTEYVIGTQSTPLMENQQQVTRDQLLARLPTAKTVPQIWIDGRHVGGCDNLYAEYNAGKISAQ